MADKKISALAAASTPLAGTEVLPIVQSSSTVKVAVSDLTAGRNVSASGATITDGGAIRVYRPGGATYTDQSMAAGGGGGYIFNNANGDGFKWQFTGVDQFVIDVNGNFVQKVAAKGVNFTANTPAAGMTSQLLNWYEHGTFTPTLTNWTIVGAESHTGLYTRIGRQVTVVIQLSAATSLASTGSSYVGGLPFSAAGTSVAQAAYMTDSGGTGSASNGYITGTTIYPGTSSATAYKFLTVTYFVA